MQQLLYLQPIKLTDLIGTIVKSLDFLETLVNIQKKNRDDNKNLIGTLHFETLFEQMQANCHLVPSKQIWWFNSLMQVYAPSICKFLFHEMPISACVNIGFLIELSFLER